MLHLLAVWSVIITPRLEQLLCMCDKITTTTNRLFWLSCSWRISSSSALFHTPTSSVIHVSNGCIILTTLVKTQLSGRSGPWLPWALTSCPLLRHTVQTPIFFPLACYLYPTSEGEREVFGLCGRGEGIKEPAEASNPKCRDNKWFWL